MKKIVDFWRANGENNSNFAIFRRFRLNLGVFNASAEGASEKFRVFYTGTANDVIIFKFQGGLRPPCSLVTPMHAGDLLHIMGNCVAILYGFGNKKLK